MPENAPGTPGFCETQFKYHCSKPLHFLATSASVPTFTLVQHLCMLEHILDTGVLLQTRDYYY